MGQGGQDFEKGEADGTADALAVLGAIAAGLAPQAEQQGSPACIGGQRTEP
jgi:hypothetical protein